MVLTQFTAQPVVTPASRVDLLQPANDRMETIPDLS